MVNKAILLCSFQLYMHQIPKIIVYMMNLIAALFLQKTRVPHTTGGDANGSTTNKGIDIPYVKRGCQKLDIEAP